MFTHTINYSWSSGPESVAQSQSKTAGQEINLEEAIPDSSTNLLVACAFDVSKLKSMFLLSDQNMTLKTNSSGSPANTISLVANVPYVWQESSYLVNLFTTNVAAFYLTNASGSAATLKMRALVDPT